jgi:alkylhydroperoxidase family enzyme
MAGNTRIPKAELTGVYGAMVKRMSRKMLGDVPEPVEVTWHNRKVLNFSFSVGRKAQKWDQCDENLKTFAHMAVASLVGCSFCLDLGYFQAHNEGVDLVKAREVPRWRDSDVFTPLERDVMEYAEAMSQTPPTAFIALANMYTRSNIALGIHSQGYSAACDLTPLAVPATA